MYEFLDKYKEKDRVIIALASHLKEKYNVTDKKLAKIIAEKTEIHLPINIFKTKLCALETTTIYLKDNLKLGFTESAKLTNRNPKTIFGAYKRGKEKGWKINSKNSTITIPLSILANRKKSTLEALITYLKDNHKLKFTDIAKMTMRTQKTIWATYKNGKEKE